MILSHFPVICFPPPKGSRPPQKQHAEERREVEAQWGHQNQLVRLSRLGVHHQLGSQVGSSGWEGAMGRSKRGKTYEHER